MEKSWQDIKDRAYALAKKYELENGNCAQSVFAAVTESLGMESEEVFRAATGFADGIGLTGDGHCGSLSGAVMAISHVFGRKKEEFHRRGKMMKALLMSRQLENKFMGEYGVCRCHDLQVKFYGRFFNLMEPLELEAAMKAGVLERCSSLAGEVASLAVELILEQQEKDAAKS
ncbi:MAG: C-GCAxxG-C-C family protein [Chloroflexi bacterium]|jgi:C_GCAxxG_C_C family probable redox protein|nr:C-GCAxxG-C-C family protein [Chloroflexota bacterium]